MSSPILVPQLECEDQRLSVSLWLMRVGEEVNQGDRIVELLIPGVTFDVAAPCSGILASCDCRPGDEVHEGAVLGWINSPGENENSNVDDARTD